MTPSRASSRPPRVPHRAAAALVTVLAALLVAVLCAAPSQARRDTVSANPITPGSFTGYGFDQCTAPSQAAMSRWTTDSPFFAAGIYISGDSRACLAQPNLTATWVRTQLAAGWHLLPITLGPQAWCTTRARYLHQVRISPAPATAYAAARAQGLAEADKAIAAATALGIVPGSTLFYDLEAFNTKTSTACTQSALTFLQGWTTELHAKGFLSGFYSSAASGIKMVDDVRATPGNTSVLPDQVWIADWNGAANSSSTYVRSDGWMPHGRVHQYQGGHNETYGGVSINIDRNYVDLGRGLYRAPEPTHCAGLQIDFTSYPQLAVGTGLGAQVEALKCLLSEKQLYTGKPRIAVYGPQIRASARAWQKLHGLPVSNTWTTRDWVSLLSDGTPQVLKYGTTSEAVYRAQRALVAAGYPVPIKGIANTPMLNAVGAYQAKVRLPKTSVMAPTTWAAMSRGLR